jgi:hypothetical protein
VQTESVVAAALEGKGGGPQRIMMWIAGSTARCVQGPFSREAGLAALREVGATGTPLWLSDWPEGVRRLGGVVGYGSWTTDSVVDEAMSVVDTARKLAETSTVELSQRLGVLVEAAKRQSEAVRDLAEVLTHSDERSTLSTSLASLFASLGELRSNLLSEQHNHHALVRQAGGTVAQLTDLSTSIRQFATSSRLATFNARLEAARLGEAGAGFLAITGALSEHAQHVTSASANASVLTQRLSALLPQVSASSEQVKRQLDAEMSALREKVTGLKQQLLESERLALTRLEAARRDGDVLAREMNAAMAELQSTDRLSQLLAAMHEAFVDARSRGGDAFGDLQKRRASLVGDSALQQGGSIELF